MHRRHSSNTKTYRPNPLPFPWQAFPAVMAGAIHDVCAMTKAPLPLVAASVLAACALACQRLHQVRMPFGTIRQLALYLLLLAISGERKSAADALIFRVITQLEKELRIEFAEALAIYRKKIASWSALQKALERKLLRAEGSCLFELQAEIEHHQSLKPTEPAEPAFILDDVTPAALIRSLHRSPSAALLTDDGRTMLLGHALSDLSLINRAWDGGPIRVDRAGGSPIALNDYKLSLCIMAQPSVLDEFMARDRGQAGRDTGFLARCLICLPDSTQGQRYFDPHAFQPEAGLQEFHKRLDELFRTNADPQIIDLDPGAVDHWTRFHNDIERDLLPGQYLSGLTDFASKAPENAARVAAIFHVMSGRSGRLQADHMQQACWLMTWYLEEAKRLFDVPVFTQEQSDAEVLATWLQSFISYQAPYVDLRKAHLYRCGPNALRARSRLDPALHMLQAQGRVSFYKHDNKTMVRYLPRAAI